MILAIFDTYGQVILLRILKALAMVKFAAQGRTTSVYFFVVFTLLLTKKASVATFQALFTLPRVLILQLSLYVILVNSIILLEHC